MTEDQPFLNKQKSKTVVTLDPSVTNKSLLGLVNDPQINELEQRRNELRAYLDTQIELLEREISFVSSQLKNMSKQNKSYFQASCSHVCTIHPPKKKRGKPSKKQIDK